MIANDTHYHSSRGTTGENKPESRGGSRTEAPNTNNINQGVTTMKSIPIRVLCALVAGLAWFGQAQAAETKLTLSTFTIPSLSAFTPPVIKAKGFDKANGLDLTFVAKSAKLYRTDFAAGTNKLGGSGTILADVAKLTEKGVETVFLFNVFDFWGTVVVGSKSGINSLKDLEGKSLAASLPTTNYAMFRFFAKEAGVDMKKVEVQSSPVPGLVPMAASGRVDAVQMWEPAHSVLTYKNDKYRAFDLVSDWKKTSGISGMPYLGVAAHKEWVDANKPLIPKLFNAYKAAADFIKANPKEAAKIVSDASKGRLKADVLESFIRSNRLGLNVYYPGKKRSSADAAFKAAMSIGYLEKMPAPGVLYDGP